MAKEGCKDSGKEVSEEDEMIILGAVERLSGSDAVLAVDEGKVVVYRSRRLKR